MSVRRESVERLEIPESRRWPAGTEAGREVVGTAPPPRKEPRPRRLPLWFRLALNSLLAPEQASLPLSFTWK